MFQVKLRNANEAAVYGTFPFLLGQNELLLEILIHLNTYCHVFRGV